MLPGTAYSFWYFSSPMKREAYHTADVNHLSHFKSQLLKSFHKVHTHTFRINIMCHRCMEITWCLWTNLRKRIYIHNYHSLITFKFENVNNKIQVTKCYKTTTTTTKKQKNTKYTQKQWQQQKQHCYNNLIFSVKVE